MKKRHTPLKIGILTGSGPDAGIDLWQKVLKYNKELLGSDFRGDLDCPHVMVLSVPELGYSMELEKNYEKVWEVLKKGVLELEKHVDIFAIACNTLNVYHDKITALNADLKLIATPDVVREYLSEHGLSKVALLGATPVMELGKYSAFEGLKEALSIEVAKDVNKLHEVIYDVKRLGANHPRVQEDFKAVVTSLRCENVFLACTELPLIRIDVETKQLIDVTDLLAQKLVTTSLYE